MKALYEKYKDIIPYAFFGVCTTVVNILSYAIFARWLGWDVMPSTIVAWVLAVLFAYLTNRKWVFKSTAKGTNEIVREICSFFACRIATGVLDWAMMYIFVERLAFNDVFIKTLANVAVIILNYVASKFVIFKKK